MTNDLDTLLPALYVDLEDRVLPAVGWSRDHRRGRKPVVTDAELLCVAVAHQLLGVSSEQGWIRYACQHLRGMFPDLPGQSESWHDWLRLVDSTPVPCAASRETVKRSDLGGHAGYGYCASYSRFFWGLRLYLIAAPRECRSSGVWPTPRSGSARSPKPCWNVTTSCDPRRTGDPGRQGLRR